MSPYWGIIDMPINQVQSQIFFFCFTFHNVNKELTVLRSRSLLLGSVCVEAFVKHVVPAKGQRSTKSFD